MPRDVGVVLVAAGEGRRLGHETPKQFLPIAGVPMLHRALRPFTSHPDVRQVVVVLPASQASAPPGWLAALAGDQLRIVAGGAQRMDSVEQGIRALGAECMLVLVHDAARPLLRREIVAAVIDQARKGTGAIAAVPLSDTLKESGPVSGMPQIRRTIPRDGLWRAQTPQGFPRPMLERAFAAARKDGATGTDEAALVERIGEPVVLVPDSGWNIKVTTPEDLDLAELIAARQQP
ncbi:MAG: 2-C-methyl-D-erythritol 4-phosphate cytidylyltransferase [Gemmatimonadota bacterium]